MKSLCPLEFFATDPFISEPLLTVINKTVNSNTNIQHISSKRSYDVRSAFPSNSIQTNSTHDFTREAKKPTEIDNHIKLASIGLIAKNIFKDIVVRPIKGLALLAKTAKTVWETSLNNDKRFLKF